MDGEDFSPLEVFYSYSNDALIEMKKVQNVHVPDLSRAFWGVNFEVDGVGRQKLVACLEDEHCGLPQTIMPVIPF